MSEASQAKIEQLEKENKRLREALEKIKGSPVWQGDPDKKEFSYHTYAASTVGIAREALKGGGDV